MTRVGRISERRRVQTTAEADAVRSSPGPFRCLTRASLAGGPQPSSSLALAFVRLRHHLVSIISNIPPSSPQVWPSVRERRELRGTSMTRPPLSSVFVFTPSVAPARILTPLLTFNSNPICPCLSIHPPVIPHLPHPTYPIMPSDPKGEVTAQSAGESAPVAHSLSLASLISLNELALVRQRALTLPRLVPCVRDMQSAPRT